MEGVSDLNGMKVEGPSSVGSVVIACLQVEVESADFAPFTAALRVALRLFCAVTMNARARQILALSPV